MKVKKNYVNNKQLFEVMKEYHSQVQQAKADETELPRVPEYVGECLVLIATRLSKKPNFHNYSYRDEMVSDGIENCLMYINNFDPKKSSNPFAYFTQIINFSFIRRIEKEKKQRYIKIKNLDHYATSEIGHEGYSPKFQRDEATDEFVRKFEQSLTNKKKSSNTGLTKFYK